MIDAFLTKREIHCGGLTLSLSQNFGSIIWIFGSIIWTQNISARRLENFGSIIWTSTKHAALGAQHDIWVVCR